MNLSRRKKWLFTILIIVVIAAIAGYKLYKTKFLHTTLRDTVETESKGIYKINYDTIVVDEVAGLLFVKNVSVLADTAVFTRDSIAGQSPSFLVNLRADSLRVLGVQTPRALLAREISARKLIISGATIEMLRMPRSKQKVADTVDSDIIENIYFDVMQQLKMVKADTIMLQNINLSVVDFKSGKVVLNSSNVSLNLYDLLIDSSSRADASRIFFAKTVELEADSVRLRDQNEHYDFQARQLSISTAAKHMRIGSIHIEPLLGEEAFMKQFKTQKDRFNIKMSGISIKGINTVRVARGELLADSMTVNQSSFMIYRDMTMPRDKLSKVGQYPHQVIMKIPFPLNIDRGMFLNSFIEYKEKNEKTKKSGRVQFNRVSAFMQNITNQEQAIKKNNLLNIHFNAWFLNVAKADVDMSLRLGDKQGRFAVKGKLGGFDAVHLNKLIEPMGSARIERGKVKEINFDMTGDNYAAAGDLTILYDNLKISSLKLEEDTREFKRKGMESFLANMIVRNKNPSGGTTRKGSMKNERNTNRSFFNLLWKSIFAGVKESAGMGSGNKKNNGQK
jgi:hypothetical protein